MRFRETRHGLLVPCEPRMYFDFSPRGGMFGGPGGVMGGSVGVGGGGGGVAPDGGGPSGGGGGGGGSSADMIFDPQTIIDTGGPTAGNGDNLFAAGKFFSAGGVWLNDGVVTGCDLVPNVTSLGTVTINHTAGPNSTPELKFLRISGNNPYLYAHQTDEPEFYNDTFTWFFVIARDSSDTAGIRAIAGTQKLSTKLGWRLDYNGTGSVIEFATNDGIGTNTDNIGSYVAGTYQIVAMQYDGSNKKGWINHYFASPDLSIARSFAKRTGTTAGALNKFQLGNDGDQTLRCYMRVAEVRMYQSALGASEFDAEMDALSTKFGIAVT